MSGEYYLGELLKEEGEYLDVEESCHDCGGPVRVTAELEEKTEEGPQFTFTAQDGARVYSVRPDGETLEPHFKCPECYQADPILRDYRCTEVYTRVVGYYQRLDRFNRGKLEEHRQRKYFDSF
jgi:hypothetical protein